MKIFAKSDKYSFGFPEFFCVFENKYLFKSYTCYDNTNNFSPSDIMQCECK